MLEKYAKWISSNKGEILDLFRISLEKKVKK
jgi:hypothetical protein